MLKANASDIERPLPELPLAAQLRFVRQYYAGVPPEDLSNRSKQELSAIALSHLAWAMQWRSGAHAVRVFNPTLEEHGWESVHTVVEVATRDRPFLVDSMIMVVNQNGFTNHLTVHPVIRIERNAERAVTDVLQPRSRRRAAPGESLMHAEIDRETDPERLDALREALDRSLNDGRVAVEDWPRMVERIRQEVAHLQDGTLPVSAETRNEVLMFLEWLLADNFTILGVRDYELTQRRGEEYLRVIPGSGLGILREQRGAQVSRSFADTPPSLRMLTRPDELLILTKSNSRSTVSRPDYLDYIGVKRSGADGRLRGELRILGLYSSAGQLASPRSIPVVRLKIDAVVRKVNLTPKSHDAKALIHILNTYPRTELFEADVRELTSTAVDVLHLQDRQRVRVFIRADRFGRYYACQVYVPRDHFDTNARLRIQSILMEELDGEQVDFTVSLSQAPLARMYLIVRRAGRGHHRISHAAIERRIQGAVRPWSSNLQQALIAQHGEEAGIDKFRSYANSFSAGYREDHPASQAVTDIRSVEAAAREHRIQTHIETAAEAGERRFIFKLFSPDHIVKLSTMLPMLENMGVFVHLEHPYEVDLGGARRVWIHDYECAPRGGPLVISPSLQSIFQEAVAAIWYGEVENDGLNALVLDQSLSARRISVLRAYAHYLRQIGTPYGLDYINAALVNNGSIARALVELFEARFSVERKKLAAREAELRDRIEAELDAVASLDEDRIVRAIYRMVIATLRTNYHQLDGNGKPKPYLSMKFNSAELPDLPPPRPAFEIFVYSPRVEGVHLRSGAIARGGIRWSDRREDYRTEILGLMKAQTVKNAVIVPEGAKGGFFVKNIPADPRTRLRHGIDCYKSFIRGLLDLTDNYVGERVVAPKKTRRHDGDDPYLVVAADKGTARFSDIANGVAAEYGFWLDDAFASGGSAGYDHKKMGITARGAWESVRHHFEILGLDVEREDFTVVGIGDMAGDVFGNGMLRSRHIKLIAAFNHQHIFIDPDPDPRASHKERRRLFRLRTSSWADYDTALLSPGGGVYPRSAKSIALSAQARAALGVEASALTPEELIRAILMAPVDLLWNGGIGTYVKAKSERHEDVGDKSNDRLRIDADALRCRVIGEGGNLGITQRGRIAFAGAGGMLNADWIDNSGGVDCSDHEVNIKILLNRAVAREELTLRERNQLLRRMQSEVASKVLNNNIEQARAISHAEEHSRRNLDWFGYTVAQLARDLNLSRELESLPSQADLRARAEGAQGLYRPELATLVAYAKIALHDNICNSHLPDDPYLGYVAFEYFPEAIRERFADDIRAHPLRREIVATMIAKDLVNRMGITFTLKLEKETGEERANIMRAYLVARDSLGMRALWPAIDRLGARVPFAVQRDMVYAARRAAERATRWLLRKPPPPEIDVAVKQFKPNCRLLTTRPEALLASAEFSLMNTRRAVLRKAGVPGRLAGEIAALDYSDRVFALTRMALDGGVSFEQAATCYAELGAKLDFAVLHRVARALPAKTIWQDRARGEVATLVDDLHAALTEYALAAGGSGAWLADNPKRTERIRSIITEVEPEGEPDLAKVFVMLNQLHGCIRP